MNILIVGSGAREHAIAKALKRSKQSVDLFCIGQSRNPGILELTTDYCVGSITDPDAVAQYAQQHAIDIAIIGPEAVLEAGVVDALQDVRVGCVGPTKQIAKIESSKSFARWLLQKHAIPGSPECRPFTSADDDALYLYLKSLSDSSGYVVKADGLMGGKGVKLSGEHLATIDEGLAYAKECFARDGRVLIEEKLVGQEFSLMSFSDGAHLAHMPAVQDHKRAFENDEGPNTGGMGSYSDANHSLPFLTPQDIADAQAMNQATVTALQKEFGQGFKGILYGGFIATKNGVKLIEYNARFGDPESMNVLTILETDFVEICTAIVDGTLIQDHARFANKATVCKYAVPEGYPDHPVKNRHIDISAVTNRDQLYYSAVDVVDGNLVETGSRTIAVVGIANTINEAEKIAEAEIQKVQGPLFHRKDIGSEALIQKRVEMMNALRG